MAQKRTFSVNNYDCLGFDLDNTILEYDITALSKLVYNILAKFLVDQKGYEDKYLFKSFESGLPFLQRGLALDFKNGNVIKLDPRGGVVMASHGTKLMTKEDIEVVYGPERVWGTAAEYINDLFSAWNGPLSERIRCVLDYFDVTCVLVFGRAVDTVDETSLNGNKKDYAEVWPDILAGLYYMYNKDGFQSQVGEFFPALREEPLKYIKRAPEATVNWLRKLRENGKFTFLLTGSAIDFATHTATIALGSSWMELFDLVICFARKPNFFIGDRPFLSIDGFTEGDPCKLIASSKVVSQGNWRELRDFMALTTGKSAPRVIYVGDNAVQDVLAPVHHHCCDALAVCEEMRSSHQAVVGVSSVWGFYLSCNDGSDTLWSSILSENAAICVPSISSLSLLPLEARLNPVDFFPQNPKVEVKKDYKTTV